MEAARAVERGFVTPDKTLLIASTHRVFAMTEKIALADGREDAAALLAACRDAARELVAFDMAALADATGSLLSAVLFGALAGSDALPFPRMAFAAAFKPAHGGKAAAPAAASLEGGARDASRAVRDLLDAAGRDFSGEARAVVMTAIPRLDDYQDNSYARHFLARLARFQRNQPQTG